MYKGRPYTPRVVPEGGKLCLTAGERAHQGERNPRTAERIRRPRRGRTCIGRALRTCVAAIAALCRRRRPCFLKYPPVEIIISSCRAVISTTGCFSTGCFFNKHGRLRRRRASKARNTCPQSPSYTCSPPSGTIDMRHLSAGYARPKGLAHPRLSMVGPLRGPMYAHRAGDHEGRPYTCG